VAEELSIPSRGYSEAYFTGLRVIGHLAPSTRFRVVSWPVQIRANNLRFFCLIKHKNVRVAGELLFHQPQALQHCYMCPAGVAMGQTKFSVGTITRTTRLGSRVEVLAKRKPAFVSAV